MNAEYEADRLRTERYYVERDKFETAAVEAALAAGKAAPNPLELRDRAHEACKHLLGNIYDGIRGEVQREQAEAKAVTERRVGGIIYQ